MYAFFDISNKNEAAIDAKVTNYRSYNPYSLASFAIRFDEQADIRLSLV